jgi:hypothetical protein
MYIQKVINEKSRRKKIFVGILKAKDEKSRIRICYRGCVLLMGKTASNAKV